MASDSHLGATSAERRAAFLEWLEQAAHVASWIILNGDLFDFWCEYRTGHTGGHDDVLAALARMAGRGVRVTLIAGNHDWWGGSHLERSVGIEYLKGPMLTEIAGRKVLVAHGDRCGKGDFFYRLLAPVLRKGPVPWAFRRLPPRVGDRLARLVSRTVSYGSEPGAAELARARVLRRWALAELNARPELDMVILGHSHVPELVPAGDSRCYVNSGDWIYHQSYIALRVGVEPTLHHWNGEIEV